MKKSGGCLEKMLSLIPGNSASMKLFQLFGCIILLCTSITVGADSLTQDSCLQTYTDGNSAIEFNQNLCSCILDTSAGNNETALEVVVGLCAATLTEIGCVGSAAKFGFQGCNIGGDDKCKCKAQLDYCKCFGQSIGKAFESNPGTNQFIPAELQSASKTCKSQVVDLAENFVCEDGGTTDTPNTTPVTSVPSSISSPVVPTTAPPPSSTVRTPTSSVADNSTPTAQNATSVGTTSSSGLSTGGIVGIVIGAAFVAACVAFAIFILRRKPQRRKEHLQPYVFTTTSGGNGGGQFTVLGNGQSHAGPLTQATAVASSQQQIPAFTAYTVTPAGETGLLPPNQMQRAVSTNMQSRQQTQQPFAPHLQQQAPRQPFSAATITSNAHNRTESSNVILPVFTLPGIHPATGAGAASSRLLTQQSALSQFDEGNGSSMFSTSGTGTSCVHCREPVPRGGAFCPTCGQSQRSSQNQQQGSNSSTANSQLEADINESRSNNRVNYVYDPQPSLPP